MEKSVDKKKVGKSGKGKKCAEDVSLCKVVGKLEGWGASIKNSYDKFC